MQRCVAAHQCDAMARLGVRCDDYVEPALAFAATYSPWGVLRREVLRVGAVVRVVGCAALSAV
jgi:hypothetical protein